MRVRVRQAVAGRLVVEEGVIQTSPHVPYVAGWVRQTSLPTCVTRRRGEGDNDLIIV